MSLPPRHSMFPPSSRHSTLSSLSSSHTNAHQSALQQRINTKRAELENLRALRDLSAQLAAQMSTLEEKLGTLRDGTEAVACILKNWEGVLGVIRMASSKIPKPSPDSQTEADQQTPELPVTLVRIPVQTSQEGGG